MTTALSHPTFPNLDVLAPRPFLIVNYEQITPVVIRSVHVNLTNHTDSKFFDYSMASTAGSSEGNCLATEWSKTDVFCYI